MANPNSQKKTGANTDATENEIPKKPADEAAKTLAAEYKKLHGEFLTPPTLVDKTMSDAQKTNAETLQEKLNKTYAEAVKGMPVYGDLNIQPLTLLQHNISNKQEPFDTQSTSPYASTKGWKALKFIGKFIPYLGRFTITAPVSYGVDAKIKAANAATVASQVAHVKKNQDTLLSLDKLERFAQIDMETKYLKEATLHFYFGEKIDNIKIGADNKITGLTPEQQDPQNNPNLQQFLTINGKDTIADALPIIEQQLNHLDVKAEQLKKTFEKFQEEDKKSFGDQAKEKILRDEEAIARKKTREYIGGLGPFGSSPFAPPIKIDTEGTEEPTNYEDQVTKFSIYGVDVTRQRNDKGGFTLTMSHNPPPKFFPRFFREFRERKTVEKFMEMIKATKGLKNVIISGGSEEQRQMLYMLVKQYEQEMRQKLGDDKYQIGFVDKSETPFGPTKWQAWAANEVASGMNKTFNDIYKKEMNKAESNLDITQWFKEKEVKEHHLSHLKQWFDEEGKKAFEDDLTASGDKDQTITPAKLEKWWQQELGLQQTPQEQYEEWLEKNYPEIHGQNASNAPGMNPP